MLRSATRHRLNKHLAFFTRRLTREPMVLFDRSLLGRPSALAQPYSNLMTQIALAVICLFLKQVLAKRVFRGMPEGPIEF